MTHPRSPSTISSQYRADDPTNQSTTQPTISPPPRPPGHRPALGVGDRLLLEDRAGGPCACWWRHLHLFLSLLGGGDAGDSGRAVAALESLSLHGYPLTGQQPGGGFLSLQLAAVALPVGPPVHPSDHRAAPVPGSVQRVSLGTRFAADGACRRVDGGSDLRIGGLPGRAGGTRQPVAGAGLAAAGADAV